MKGKSTKADYKDTFKTKHAGVTDMTLLTKIENNEILNNLRMRFDNHEIYVK